VSSLADDELLRWLQEQNVIKTTQRLMSRNTSETDRSENAIQPNFLSTSL